MLIPLEIGVANIVNLPHRKAEIYLKIQVIMNRHNLFIICILLLINISVNAQFSDDFSDGNFSENPKWEGDTAQFIVNGALQLQLNGNESGRALLMTVNPFHEEAMEWRFFVKLSFSPSGNNYARIHLTTNQSVENNNTLTGFFLQLGEAGSNDVPELFYQENGAATSVLRCERSIASGVALYIKVIKESGNQWRLFAAESREGIYEEIGSGESPPLDEESVFSQNQYFGIECVYTSGNKTKFYFDDFYCGPPLIDTVLPHVVKVTADRHFPQKLEVLFSEAVSENALDASHYTIPENLVHPASCRFTDEQQRSVELLFADNFTERENYHLLIEGVADLNGNIMTDTLLPFLFYTLRRNEVVISEIMADPSPPVGLPASEYVELHNRLPFDITLNGWPLRIGTNDRTLTDVTIPAEGEVVVVSAATLDLWDSTLNLCAVNSFSLTDDGQRLTLLSDEGETIHYVAYKKAWHRNPLKRDGGWSLEMIDTDNPCAGADNWDSSVAAEGGTPGTRNSIAADNKDAARPAIAKVTVPDDRHVRVFFTEPVIADTAAARTVFSIDRGVMVAAASENPPDFTSVTLTLNPPLAARTVYTLTLHDTLCDCVGNRLLDGDFATFGLPETPVAGDLILNEVLSNPFGDTDGDYIELYNRSDKILDLGKMRLGSGNGEVPDNAVECVPDGFLLFPQHYAAICKNRTLTLEQYAPPLPQNLLENEKLPSYSNDAGTVRLLDAELNPLDRFSYDVSMHYPLLLSTDGVALERIHLDGLTQDNDNWMSAAEGYGWGTPGYRNSQYSEAGGGDGAVTVEPEVISPNGDGYHDFAEVFCRFPTTGQRATIDIYDRDGHRIRRLSDNRICGTDERFRWDGATDDGRTVSNGLYVVFVRVWNLEGRTKNFRKVVAVARE